MDSFPNCLVCMVCCWEIRAYFSSCFCFCVFTSSYTVLYASVIDLVNSARVEVLGFHDYYIIIYIFYVYLISFVLLRMMYYGFHDVCIFVYEDVRRKLL